MTSIRRLLSSLGQLRPNRLARRHPANTRHRSSACFDVLEDRTLLTPTMALIAADQVDDQSRSLSLDASQYAQVSPSWFASLDIQPNAGEADTSQWIVRLNASAIQVNDRPSEAAATINNPALGLRAERGLGLPGMMLVQATASASAVQAYLSALSTVSYFGPNGQVSILKTPNDSSYGSLWGMNNTGQSGGTVDADIDAPEAWDLSTGSSSIVVGVIDTGVDYNHPDLAANIWTNPLETPGNGLDDDANGFIDDIHGYDFVNNDGDPMDDNGHGTHCAGTIGGTGNDTVGVVGVNWSSSIMALKFLAANREGNDADAIRAINYATMMRHSHGVNIRVLSNSWGGGPFNQAMLDAIDASGNEGILFVAAAANGGIDDVGDNNDTLPHYPSSYTSQSIVSVAATDHNDALAGFSNYGVTSVDLAAPGISILSTTPGNTYGSFSGTSMATPHMAGIAALGWSFRPNVTVAEMKSSLLAGVDLIAGLNGKTVTGGRANAIRTLHALSAITPDRFEANDLQAVATDVGVAPGVHLTGLSTHNSTDQDWYRFELLRPEQLHFSLTFEPNAGALNFEIVHVEGGNTIASAPNGTGASTDATLPAGIYYVHVSGVAGAINDYRLSIDPAGSTPRVFYVNDNSTAGDFHALVAGNDLNDGRSPELPKATVQDVLDDYDLGPGDLVQIDTGNYSTAVLIAADDEGAIYVGSSGGTTMTSGGTFELLDADFNTLYWLNFSGGSLGVYVHPTEVNASTDNVLRRLEFSNVNTSIRIEGGAENLVVKNHHGRDLRHLHACGRAGEHSAELYFRDHVRYLRQ